MILRKIKIQNIIFIILNYNAEIILKIHMDNLGHVIQITQWLPTSTNPKIVSPFTLHLQQDQASVIGNLKIDIAQIEVSKSNNAFETNITI